MAFEEALRKARDRDVDFILLGGDLFHMNKPSASIEHKCIRIIKKHMNEASDRCTSFKRISGSFSHFKKLNHANFEDPNLKVPYPIMTIHGNHDDPTGPTAQSVCEKLATCGLLNYFGAIDTSSNALTTVIEPIVLQKGKIKLALYGLGFIPDQKLKIALEKGEIVFSKPPKDTFNILVVHQNRVPHNKNRVIPDEMFPKFFHLLVRGHEHDTQSPEKIPDSEVNGIVYQPGSTVATSISTMEVASKKVGLISVSLGDEEDAGKSSSSLYKMNYELIGLKCCRPMIFKDISQKEIFAHIKKTSGSKAVTSSDFKKMSQEYVVKCIKSLIALQGSHMESVLSSHEGPEKLYRFRMPLMRIRLEYTSKSERFDEMAVNCKFYPAEVANKKIVHFKKQQVKQSEDGEVENITFLNEDDDDDPFDDIGFMDLDEERVDIDRVIEDYFKDNPKMQLQALSLDEYTNAIRGSVVDGNVISKVLNKKKQYVFNRYKQEIADEERAKSVTAKSGDVELWFMKAFTGSYSKSSKDAGDEMDID